MSPPLVDQTRRDVILARHIRHDRTGRKRRRQYPALFVFTPTPSPLRPGQQGHLAHDLLLCALIRTPYKRSINFQLSPYKAALRGGLPSVRNILDFPKLFSPPAAVVTLEQNYRSTHPILDATNAVIALATETNPKRLFSSKRSDEKPQLVGAADEAAEVEYVVHHVLEYREAGIDLKRQAVFRVNRCQVGYEPCIVRNRGSGG
jgi:hypothetical protein